MKAKFGFSLALLLTFSALAFVACDKDNDPNTIDFSATLTDAPGITTAASGDFDATYDDDNNNLSYTLTWVGLDPTAAHLHNVDDPTQIVPLAVSAGIDSPVEGTVNLTAAQEAILKNGKYYVNVHTIGFPDGEIQGTLTQK